jgi:ribonuclease P/MRP protein subunit POP1
MSHNAHRLPSRLKQRGKKELEQMNTSSPQITSRKKKRRPRFALEEHKQRSEKVCWLETHIWHAKRFKMRNLWGFKIVFEFKC